MNKKRQMLFVLLSISAFTVVDGKEVLTADQRAKLGDFGFSEEKIAEFEAEALNIGNKASGAEDGQASATDELATLRAQLSTLTETSAADKATIAEKETLIAELKNKIQILSDMPDVADQTPAPAQAQNSAAIPFNLQDTKQLGGQPGAMFSLSRAYNQRARAAMLAAEGVMMSAPVQNDVDFKALNEDLGAFYRTPWKERVQSFLLKLPSIYKLFPEEAGHQDLDTLVSVFLGEFSQADSSDVSDFDKVSKGTYEFQAETLRMYGVMFVHTFKSLKKLEKSWIGYLNREKSNPVKLSFIEFLLVETAKVLHNEQQLRFVNGVRKNPQPDEPGRAMDAADGLYEFVRKRVEGYTCFNIDGGLTGKTVYQIKPFDLPEITPGNIGEVVYLGTSMVPAAIRDSGSLVLYMPSFMEAWYNKYNEAKYGQNQDYKPDTAHVKEYPSVAIKYVPNADNHHRLIWTVDGNIKTYCRASGEMLNFNLEVNNWTVRVWSNWKESIQAEAVGKMFTDPALMDGTMQLIWCNGYDRPENYFVEGEPDKNPDVLIHSSVVTAKNSQDFAITDIENAKVGKIVSIKCGPMEGVSINNTGKFALLGSKWEPKRGDVIRLMKRSDDKFIEIGRTSADSEALQFAPDAATPSVLNSTVFVTGVNTAATEITDLADALPGVVYTIHGFGAEATASTIKNAGKFSLTANIILEAGKFIKLVKASGDKFYEVERG